MTTEERVKQGKKVFDIVKHVLPEDKAVALDVAIAIMWSDMRGMTTDVIALATDKTEKYVIGKCGDISKRKRGELKGAYTAALSMVKEYGIKTF